MWLIENIAHAVPLLVAMWDSGFYQTMPIFSQAFAVPEEYR